MRMTILLLAALLSPGLAFAQAISPDLAAINVADSQAGKTLITADGTWNFGPNVGPGGNEILLNGNGSNGGQAQMIQVGDSGKMFAYALDNSWWVYNKQTGWSPSPGTPFHVTCMPPTTYTNGATITKQLTFTFFHGTSPKDITSDVRTNPTCDYTWYGLTGTHYWMVTAKDPSGSESAFSAQVAVAPLGSLPMPPTSIFVKAQSQVFAVKQTKDHLATTNAVGTVPTNTPCDVTQRVNDMFVVPVSAVTWYGNVRPQVVVAKCTDPGL